MECPNCGRTVRSKTQCAHCGYVFGSGEAKQANNAQSNDDVTRSTRSEREARAEKQRKELEFEEVSVNSQPESRSDYSRNDDDIYVYEEEKERSGCGRVVGFIIKLLVAVVLVFLLFLYGPQLYEMAMDYFNGDDQTEQTEQTSEAVSEATSEVESTEGEGDASEGEETEGEGEGEASSEGESANEESTDEDVAGASWSMDTNMDEYPVVTVTMTPEDGAPVGSIDNETFTFELTNGNTSSQEITDYSLTTEGDDLVLSFSDPALNVISADPQEQVLSITSEDLNVSETVTYEIPSNGLDQDQVDTYNQVINDAFTNGEEVTAFIGSNDEETAAFTYDSQTKDAGNLISWFVIERVYQAIEDNELAIEDTVTLNEALLADGDVGPLSEATEEEEYTIGELLDLAIQDQDLTAMNHLIQEVGGPNEFNVWLNENSYFSTRVNNLLSMSDDGGVAGALTNVQDLGQLLNKLSEDTLVSEEASADIKERLLLTPYTAKYPENGIEGVVSRYEIASTDENAEQQYYSAILETEETDYVVITMVSNFDDAEETVSTMSSVINDSMSYAVTGEISEEEEEVSSEEVSEETSEESTVAEEPVESFVAEEPVQNESTEVTYEEPVEQYTPQNPEYYEQYVPSEGAYVTLPDRSIVNANGERVEPTWFFDEGTGTYRYTFE
ncbi:serine hydrolase [Aerococcaceae bacterium DSM 111176]|nr:serine hydrolase [Aerococcaceae bacterium DSM 111176]